ncbi:surface carbohydrate biosynthesis protein [Selenomonas ruminis]|uniref:Uncharacterized protein n=1 Tax=Selenomonas ruminis TaxID=2593411 RepID=A0A5D6W9E0_9FIRM|nr:surface carbohydrate biosynthesis protein [Selenomonas sp. mPRGC5]TYZ24506.1 hypothetical protein FZ040_00205 [Selenomonas sp. mPRGC5]
MASIVILYEHKAREMETVLLLRYELMRRRHDVSIFQIDDLSRMKYLFKKTDLVITPFLYGDYELKKYVLEIFGCVNRICNLQWEQIYNRGGKNNPKRNPKGNAKYATHICWGMDTYNRLISDKCINSVITGAPQMDFLKDDFNNWYLDKETLYSKYGIDKNKKTLLFISSFSYLGLSDEKLEELKLLVDFNPYLFRDLTEKSRDVILSWFDNIMRENDNINIIYRPHPGEVMDDRMRDLCNRYKNIFFIGEESVSQWIVRCDAILNWYSTAGVEAFFANKNNIFLRPFEFPIDMDYEMFGSVCTAKTYNDFRELILNEEAVNEYYKNNPLDKKVALYYLIDKKFSFIKIVGVIEKMLQEKEDTRISSAYRCRWRWYSLFKSYIKLIVYKSWKHSDFFATKIVKNINVLQRVVESCLKKETETIKQEDICSFDEKFRRIYKADC